VGFAWAEGVVFVGHVYSPWGILKCVGIIFLFLGEYNMCWENCNGVGLIGFISGRVYSPWGILKCVGIILLFLGV
jgi:hypothetical protein